MVPVIDGWMLHTHPVVSENGKHRCIARMWNSSKMPGSASRLASNGSAGSLRAGPPRPPEYLPYLWGSSSPTTHPTLTARRRSEPHRLR